MVDMGLVLISGIRGTRKCPFRYGSSRRQNFFILYIVQSMHPINVYSRIEFVPEFAKGQQRCSWGIDVPEPLGIEAPDLVKKSCKKHTQP